MDEFEARYRAKRGEESSVHRRTLSSTLASWRHYTPKIRQGAGKWTGDGQRERKKTTIYKVTSFKLGFNGH